MVGRRTCQRTLEKVKLIDWDELTRELNAQRSRLQCALLR